MTTDDPDLELVQVGETGRAHGIDGEIRVFTAKPHWDYFAQGRTVFLEKRRGPDEYTIASWRVADEFVIAKFESVENRTEAERLTNLGISVPAEALPDLAGREFYHYDLEGRDVLVEQKSGSSDREDLRSIGTVEGIFETGANDVLVVGLEDGDELYVPMFEGAVAEIEPGDRVILRPLDSWAPDGTDI